MRLEMDHALLEVEKAVVCVAVLRSKAWHVHRQVLEHQPDGGIGENAVSRMIQRDSNQYAKYEANLRRAKTGDDSDSDAPKLKQKNLSGCWRAPLRVLACLTLAHSATPYAPVLWRAPGQDRA